MPRRTDSLKREVGGVAYRAKLAPTGRWLIWADGKWLYGKECEKAMTLLGLKDKRWVRKSQGRPPTYVAVPAADGLGWVIKAENGRVVSGPERKEAMKELGVTDPEPKPWVPPKRKNIVEIEQDDPSIPF